MRPRDGHPRLRLPRRRRWLAACAGTTLAWGAHAAEGPPGPLTELPEIVVTAHKQPRTLEQTAASVSVLDGEFLREIGARNFQDVQDYSANIGMSLSHAAGVFAVRGFATPDTNPGFDPSVGVVVDGVYYGRAQFLASFFHDVERFEVLRGPQGTLFGKNCTAGIFNVVTRAPTQELGVDAEIRGSSFGERSLKPALNLPFGGGWSLRLAGDYTTDDRGVVFNTFLERPEGDTQVHTTRARLRFRGGSPLQVDVEAFRSDSSFNNSTFQLARLTAPMRELVQRYDPRADDRADDFLTSANLPAANVAVIDGLSSTLEYDFAGVLGLEQLRLTSITATAQSKTSRLDLDADFSPVPFIHNVLAEPKLYRQVSQELRVAGENDGLFGWGRRVDFVAGLYLSRSTFKTSDIFAVEDLGAAAQYCAASSSFCGQSGEFGALTSNLGRLAGLAGGGLSAALAAAPPEATVQEARTRLVQETPGWAIFGQFEQFFTEQWALIGGLRYDAEKKRGVASSTHQGEIIPRIADQEDHVTPIARSEHAWSPKTGLKWQPDGDTEIWGTWAQGYKSGGFNGLPLNTRNHLYEPELASSHELGAKKRALWLGTPVRVSFTLFHTDFDNLQVSTFKDGAFVVLNAASARSRGFEMDLNWLPLRGASLYSSIGYADARYKSYPDAPALADSGAQTQDLSGRPLAWAPRWTATVVPAWRTDLFGAIGAMVAVDVLHRGSRYLDVDDDERKRQPATQLYNARLVLEDWSRRWTVTLGAHNLGDVPTYDQMIGQPLAPGNFVAFRTDRGRYFSLGLGLRL